MGAAPDSPIHRVPSHPLLDFARDVIVPQQVHFREGSADMQYTFGHHSLQGARDKMEDRVILQDLSSVACLQPCRRAVLLAVMDGHSGSAAADLLADRLLPALLQSGRAVRGAPLEALRAAVLVCEEELMSLQCLSGTTAVVALLLDGDLYLANVGDSRAVVCDDGEARQLTADHKPFSNQMERARLQLAGARLSEDNYVQLQPPGCACSDLGVSRALGGAHLKQPTFSLLAASSLAVPAVAAAACAAGQISRASSVGSAKTSISAAVARRRSSSNGGSESAGAGGGPSSPLAAPQPSQPPLLGIYSAASRLLQPPAAALSSPQQTSVAATATATGAGQPTGLPPRGPPSPRTTGPISPSHHTSSTSSPHAPLPFRHSGGSAAAAIAIGARSAPLPGRLSVPAALTPPASPAGLYGGASASCLTSPLHCLPRCSSFASSLDEPLALTRGPSASLATAALSAGVVIPDPDLFHYAVTQDSEFLILACDGLWDTVRNSEGTRKVRRWLADGHSAQEAARLLGESAIKLGSTDNVTTVILRFSSRPFPGARPTNSMLTRHVRSASGEEAPAGETLLARGAGQRLPSCPSVLYAS